MNFQVIETFNNGDSNKLGAFATETEARKFYDEQLKEDGYKKNDMESCELELIHLTLYEDGDIKDIETIECQTLYNEGSIDRNNHKGDCAIDYGFESVWNAKEQELEYTFYFQGKKKEETVLESGLQSWFF